jgi:hypothetical protein
MRNPNGKTVQNKHRIEMLKYAFLECRNTLCAILRALSDYKGLNRSEKITPAAVFTNFGTQNILFTQKKKYFSKNLIVFLQTDKLSILI